MPVHYRGLIGNSEKHERKEIRRRPKYPRRLEIPRARGEEGKGPIGNQLGKESIKSSMS